MPSTTLDQILNPGGKRPWAASVPVSSAMEGGGDKHPASQPAQAPNPAAPSTTQTPAQINADLQKANAKANTVQGQQPAPAPAQQQTAAQSQEADHRTSVADITAAPAPLVKEQPKLSQEQQTLTTVKPKSANTFVDMINYLNPYKVPSKEDLEKEEKQKKRQRLFAAIGDGLSALSNLYFTTQYAPNMYDGTKNLGKTVEDRWDKIKKDRDAQLKEYSTALMKARYYDELAAHRAQEAARKADKDKAEKARKDALADAQRNKYDAAARKDDGTTAYYAAKADALEKGYPLDVALKEAQIAKLKAEADKARRQGTSEWVSGKGGKSGGSGSGAGQYRVYDRHGNEHWFKKKEDGKAFALQEGTWVEDHTTSRVTKDDGYGGKTTTDTRKAVNGRSVRPSKPAAAKPASKGGKNKSYANTKKLGL